MDTNKLILDSFNKVLGLVGKPIKIKTVTPTTTINTNAIIKYIDALGDKMATGVLYTLIDTFTFKVPFCNCKKGDIVLYKNNKYKINSIDYSIEGILTLYCIYEGISAEYKITLTETNTTLMIDNTYQIVSSCTENGIIIENPAIIYVSNNPNVVKVSSTGIITGIAEGDTSITCTYEGISATISVTVTAIPQVELTPIKIVGEEYVSYNTTQIYRVYVDDGNSFSRIVPVGRTFKFELDEDTIEDNLAEIVSVKDTTCTIKALSNRGSMVELTARDNADGQYQASFVLYVVK